MSRRLLPLAALLAALVVAAPAAAAGPVLPAPVPAPAAGKLSISLDGGLATKKRRYVSRNQQFVVKGTVKPYVAGQVVTVSMIRGGKVRAHKRAKVAKAAKGRGKFSVRFKSKRRGVLRITATHAASAVQAAFRAKSKRVSVVGWQAGGGRAGLRVLLLQRGLRKLGYAIPTNGHFDAATARALIAFRKTNGLSRVGYASKTVYAKVLRGQGRFKLRHPKAGRHVEFDWSRQVLVLADHGRPLYTFHASSGKPSTPTVFGTFRFYSQTPGTNAKGMVDSNYFIGGYAIHGYPEVPTYAASHGCIRIPIPNARFVMNHVSLGEKIFVYR